MNTVQPIKSKDIIRDIQDYLKIKNERDYVLFCMGIYVPFRITDLLKLKVRDVRGKAYISTREKKTNKENRIPINDELKKILNAYICDKKDYEYLFPSRQKNRSGYYGAITRQQVHRIMKDVEKEFKLQSIGCHSLRKTFGYHYYEKHKDLEALRRIYKHTDTSITARYIGLTQATIDNAIMDIKY